MGLQVNVDFDESGLPQDAKLRASANRQALSARQTNAADAARITAQVRPQVEQTLRRQGGGVLPRPNREDLTATVRPADGFRFYFTAHFITTDPINGVLNRIQQDYTTLTNLYGDGWPTGLTQVQGLPPYYTAYGLQLGQPFQSTYFSAQFDQLNTLDPFTTPQAAQAPFNGLISAECPALTVQYQGTTTPELERNLTQGFSGSLGRTPRPGQNIMLAISPDYWWDVPGWPAPITIPPPNGPLWSSDGGTPIPITTASGGNQDPFPAFATDVSFCKLQIEKGTYNRPYDVIYRSCSPSSGPFPCEFITTIGPLFGRYANVVYQGIDGTIYEEPGFDVVPFIVRDGYICTGGDQTYYLPPTPTGITVSPDLHTFRPAALRTALEASQAGFVVTYLFEDTGIATLPLEYDPVYKLPSGADQTAASFVFAALASGVTLLDLRTPILPNSISESYRSLLAAWIVAQYPIAQRIDSLSQNPRQTFFSLLSHTLSTSANPRTPYAALTNALTTLRSNAVQSVSPATVTAIQASFQGPPFAPGDADRLIELLEIRYRVSRAMVAQYLGQEAVAALERGEFNTPAARGRLQRS